MDAESDSMIHEPERVADVDILKKAMAILERELSKKPDAWMEKSSGYIGYLSAQTLAVITEASDGLSEAEKNRLTQMVASSEPALTECEAPRTPDTARGAMVTTVKEWQSWQRLSQR